MFYFGCGLVVLFSWRWLGLRVWPSSIGVDVKLRLLYTTLSVLSARVMAVSKFGGCYNNISFLTEGFNPSIKRNNKLSTLGAAFPSSITTSRKFWMYFDTLFVCFRLCSVRRSANSKSGSRNCVSSFCYSSVKVLIWLPLAQCDLQYVKALPVSNVAA